MRLASLALFLSALLPLAGCATGSDAWVELNGQRFEVEVADDDAERNRGLMFRESLAEGAGMLFVHDAERPLAYWMKNTKIPLDIFYFDASRKLFPAFAQATGLKLDDVTWESMDPPLREPMLVRGDVDAITGHYFTSILNLEAQGVSKDDLTVFKYFDYGMDFYGNAMIASPDMMENHPEELRGFLRAVVKGWRDAIANPEEAIAALKEIDPLIDPALEVQRLQMTIDDNVVTDVTLKEGMGQIKTDRMEKAIDQVSLAFGIENKPTVGDMFTDIFMPGEKDRMLK